MVVNGRELRRVMASRGDTAAPCQYWRPEASADASGPIRGKAIHQLESPLRRPPIPNSILTGRRSRFMPLKRSHTIKDVVTLKQLYDNSQLVLATEFQR